MAQIASLRLHTDAVIAALEAAGLAVGDADDPTDPYGWQAVEGASTFLGYAIVYTFPGDIFSGPYGCPDDDATLIWQVTCVGATRAQSESIADLVNAALLGLRLPVTGRTVDPIRGDVGTGGGRRDDTVEPNLFISTPRFRAFSSPT